MNLGQLGFWMVIAGALFAGLSPFLIVFGTQLQSKYEVQLAKTFTAEDNLKLEENSDPIIGTAITKGSDNYYIKVDIKKTVDSLAIDVPIAGKVKKVHDYNSAADGTVVSKKVVGPQTDSSQNNVEIVMENIRANRVLGFYLNLVKPNLILRGMIAIEFLIHGVLMGQQSQKKSGFH